MRISFGHNMERITQAVILAGGEGKRLRPFTLKNPKCMITVNGKPFLEYLIKLLKENGIQEIIILTGYLGDKIEKYFGNGSKFGVRIKYSFTPFKNGKGEENESGTRLKNAQNLLNDFFLLLYCDNYWPLNLKNLITFFNQHPSDVLVTAYSNLDNSTKNNVFIDHNGYAVSYDSSRGQKFLNAVDIGFFLIRKDVLKLLPEYNSKFEDEVLSKLILKKRLSGYFTDNKYYSISDKNRAKTTAKFLYPKKVILLDRDGVINKKPPKADYVKNWKEFIFLPGSIEAIKLLKSKGYKIFIASNQSGIARRQLSEKDLGLIHKKMQQELKRNNTKIDGIYYCPHGWNDGCNCRKPKPGLLLTAAREHLFDLTKTIFIGDDQRDREAGERVDCKTILVTPTKNLLKIARLLIE